MSAPKPILNKYDLDKEINLEASAVAYFLYNDLGEIYSLHWHGDGWAVKWQESFLCKDKTFKHQGDIPSFKYSYLGGTDWPHIFDSKEIAIESFKQYLNKYKEEK